MWPLAIWTELLPNEFREIVGWELAPQSLGAKEQVLVIPDDGFGVDLFATSLRDGSRQSIDAVPPGSVACPNGNARASHGVWRPGTQDSEQLVHSAAIVGSV